MDFEPDNRPGEGSGNVLYSDCLRYFVRSLIEGFMYGVCVKIWNEMGTVSGAVTDGSEGIKI